MKLKLILFCLALLLFTSSCGVFRSRHETRFSANQVELGMSKNSFIKQFGNPNMQNTFMQDGITVDELLYMETIFFRSEPRKINSIFVFENGKLVHREQYEDDQYLEEQKFKRFMEMQKKIEESETK